jgi:hypothetical protein
MVGSANCSMPTRMRRMVAGASDLARSPIFSPRSRQSMATAAGRTNGSTIACRHLVWRQRYTYCWRYLPMGRRWGCFHDCTVWLISSQLGHQASGRGRTSGSGRLTAVNTLLSGQGAVWPTCRGVVDRLRCPPCVSERCLLPAQPQQSLLRRELPQSGLARTSTVATSSPAVVLAVPGIIRVPTALPDDVPTRDGQHRCPHCRQTPHHHRHRQSGRRRRRPNTGGANDRSHYG